MNEFNFECSVYFDIFGILVEEVMGFIFLYESLEFKLGRFIFL